MSAFFSSWSASTPSAGPWQCRLRRRCRCDDHRFQRDPSAFGQPVAQASWRPGSARCRQIARPRPKGDATASSRAGPVARRAASGRVSPSVGPRFERNPLSLLDAPVAGLGQLNITDSCREIARKRCVIHDVPKEIFPADPIWIDGAALIRHFIPAGAIVNAKIAVGIEVLNGRRICPALYPAAVEARNRRASGAVGLKTEKIVATDTGRPRANDCSDSAVREFSQCQLSSTSTG